MSFLLMVLSHLAAPVHAVKAILLTGIHWTVEIDPSTLAVTGKFPDGARLPVSLGRADFGTAANVQSDPRRAAWDLPAAHLHVTVGMEDDRLAFEAVSSRPGKIVWPVLGADPSLRGFMLPVGEGFYVPAGEETWQNFVLQQSPISTMESLSMPIWGIDYGTRSLTYILLNPFDNDLEFERRGNTLGLRLTHAFQSNYAEMRYGMTIVPGNPSPIEPAKIFRKWLVSKGRFATLRQKLERVPELERLFGAAHVYLWAGGILDADDVRQWPPLIQALRQPPDPAVRRVVSMLPPSTAAALRGAAADSSVSRYLKSEIIEGLNAVIRAPGLYQDSIWPLESLPEPAGELVRRGVEKLSGPELAKLNGSLLSLTFPQMLVDSTGFGGGVSPKMIARLRAAGLERLWLGVSDIDVLQYLPETVSAARRAGYLFGTYDSYHSIHPPDAKETWPTAQFDRELFEKGAIIREDGRPDRGFRGVGSHLSSIAAEPWVRRRVGALMKDFGFNSYFVDCDATGELFDNYSPLYPATKELDMRKRLERLAWIRDTYKLVVGSEVGAWFAAGDIHFGHGMMTPVFGYQDPLLRDPKSPYFMGRWFPAGAPSRFFTHTVLPDKYKDIYFDPRYRLPLYQAAFHDSIITTHHWEYPSWKFTNVQGTNELLELLYGVPPLYHLDLRKLEERKEELQRHNAVFSPNYRRLATVPLTEFSWLTPDRLVQMTRFGEEASVVANFGTSRYMYQGRAVPSSTILLIWEKTGQEISYRSLHPSASAQP